MISSARRASAVLVCETLIIAIAMGVRHAFGVFLRPVTLDLALPREAFAMPIALQNLVWGLAQPLADAPLAEAHARLPARQTT